MFIKNKFLIVSVTLLVSLVPVSYAKNDGGCRQVFSSSKEEIDTKLANKDQFVRDYKGQAGYLRFTKELSNINNMDTAYKEVSARLNKQDMQKLKWQQYQGNPIDYKKEQDQILNSEGEIRQEYIGREGYALYADRHHSGDMLKSYINVSVVLDQKDRKKLEWQKYQGNSIDYKKERTQILTPNGEVRREYRGSEGYALYADRHHSGDMLKSYKNVSAVLDKKDMQKLEWQAYRGNSIDYKKERTQILTPNGEVKLKYRGSEGYALYADRYHSADMQKTYLNVSAVLGGVHKIRQLGLAWKKFEGSTSQYQILKALFNKYGLEQLKASKGGQDKVAREIFNGNKKKAYLNVSALREELLGNRSAFNELKWVP